MNRPPPNRRQQPATNTVNVGIVHAKGVLLQGTFSPTAEAATLSTAPHFHRQSTPVFARFSSFTGLPEIPDNDPHANPRGFALRFMLEESPRRVHTDIVTHSTPFFPAKDGKDAVGFFSSLKDGTVADFVASHPAAKAFVEAPKPAPVSFATEKFYGVNAFKLVNKDGDETFIRYRIVPRAGEAHVDDAELKTLGVNYAFDSVPELLEKGPIEFDIVVQVAEPSDVTDDCTIQWPEDRKLVTLGTISLDSVTPGNPAEQKKIIFDPVPRVEGIEPSADPLIDIRAAIYLTSGKERRAA